jgi:prephenate dehydrogenase
MVMHNAGCDQAIYNHIKQYFADRGLQIIEMQPDEHDALAAKSQFFSQLIKASAQIQKLHPTLIDTPGASALFESFSLMNIPGELLLDMHNYNKYAKKVLEETIRSLNHIKKKSEKK